MDLEVWEVILVESEHGLRPTDGWVLSVELDKAHVCMDRINGERAAEVEQLSRWFVRSSDVLIDLGMLPIQDIPQLL
jgi:RecA/RadA recombinase